jgi:hypothetical protein
MIGLLCIAGQVKADDWPVLHHDAQNTSYSADLLKPPFRLAWRVPINARYGGALLAAGDTLCVSYRRFNPAGAGSIAVTLFDATGKPTWTIPQATAINLSSDSLIVINGGQQAQSIDCYDRQTHMSRWSYPLKQAPFYSYAIGTTGPDQLCCTAWSETGDSYRPTMTILNIRDGKPIRTVENIDAQASDGSHLYWGSGHWFHVADAATWQPQWGYFDGGDNPIVAGSVVIGHGWGNWATAIDTQTRQAIWRRPVWRDGIHVLLHTSNGRLRVLEATNVPTAATAFDLDADHIAWQHALDCNPFGPGNQAAGTGHYAFVPGVHRHLPGRKLPRGGFYCLDADTGAERWKYERPNTEGSAMIISGGCLFGLDNQGYLYKFIPIHSRPLARVTR